MLKNFIACAPIVEFFSLCFSSVLHVPSLYLTFLMRWRRFFCFSRTRMWMRMRTSSLKHVSAHSPSSMVSLAHTHIFGRCSHNNTLLSHFSSFCVYLHFCVLEQFSFCLRMHTLHNLRWRRTFSRFSSLWQRIFWAFGFSAHSTFHIYSFEGFVGLSTNF